MNLLDAGETAHFIIRYDDTIGAHAATRAQAVLATCEHDLAKTAFYLPYSMGGGGDPFLNDSAGDHRIVVRIVDLVTNRGGADNEHHTGAVHPFHTINIGAINSAGNEISDDYARFLFIAELAEVLMLSYGWDPAVSSGEALSRVMAEQLYPAQAYGEGNAPWVNAWFSDASRVYTYLVQNEYTDRNAVTFGVGILYINYLRSQRGYSLRDICMSGGQTFLDRYRNLSGHPQEDGIAPFRALLEKHFPAGTTLLTNNPFPLYDASGRTVSLAIDASAYRRSALRDRLSSAILGSWVDEQEKTVHLSPFITCPAKDYTYSGQKTPRRLEVVATAVGFALPRFKWRVNGHELTWASDSVIVAAKVEIDDPAHPDEPKRTTDNFGFSYTHADEFSFSGLNNRLVIENSSYAGRYMLDIEVTVEDRYGPAGSTHASTSARIDTYAVIYEESYYTDRERCAAKTLKAVEDHNRGLAEAIKVVDTLPDPPEPEFMRALLHVLTLMSHEVVSSDAEQQVVRDAAHLVAGQLGVPPESITRALGVHRQGPQALK